ncbi:DUF2849 domain-containing protein [Minwuia sp.]|uniref:DUF2849 domain-containing protein n=1 Tax=Minwuia sp. TaxID=2493630 RepID=UPI003A9089E2
MSLHIITANRLNDGLAIFLGDQGWSLDIADATVAEDKESVAQLLERAETQPAIAVGPYEIAVERTETGLRPTKYRERLRVTGPSVDYLKPQAA